MKKRIIIQEVENGYEMEVWKEDSDNEMGYGDTKKYIAKDKDELMELLTKYC